MSAMKVGARGGKRSKNWCINLAPNGPQLAKAIIRDKAEEESLRLLRKIIPNYGQKGGKYCRAADLPILSSSSLSHLFHFARTHYLSQLFLVLTVPSSAHLLVTINPS